MAPPAQRPPSSNGMGHRGVHREEKEGEGGIHARSQASGKRPKRPRKRERERKCLIYVLQWAGRLLGAGANVVLCEAIFRQREVKKGREAVQSPQASRFGKPTHHGSRDEQMPEHDLTL